MNNQSKEHVQPELKNELELCWLGAIEDTEVRGKYKRALLAHMSRDVADIGESLDDASPSTRAAWKDFCPEWAAAEVERVHRNLVAIRTLAAKAPWEIARSDRRRRSKNMLKTLENEIVSHVRKAGGAIDYAPAYIAKQLSKTHRTLEPARVTMALRQLCRKGIGKKVETRRSIPARFELVACAVKADRQNAQKHHYRQRDSWL